MPKLSIINRILLLLTVFLASFEIVTGIEGYNGWSLFYFTIVFGILVLAALFIMIMGYEILDNSLVVIIATLIPLSLSLAIIAAYIPSYHSAAQFSALLGFILIIFSRFKLTGKKAILILAFVHGLAGMIIFILPVLLSISGNAPSLFFLIGIGGALFGLTGMVIAFVKTGRLSVSMDSLISVFPAALFILTALIAFGLSI